MYVRAQDLSRWAEGSLEQQIERAEAAVAARVGGPVELLYTRPDGALFRAADGTLQEAVFVDGEVAVRPAPVPQFEAAALPRLVADELRAVTRGLLEGEAVRGQVRALVPLLRAGEEYWLTGVLRRVDEVLAADAPGHWHTEYKAHQERIRTAMWGSIREVEGRLPKTAYARLPAARLSEFDPELRESLGVVATVLHEIVDGCATLVFDKGSSECSAIESLTVEAQLLRGLLAKAGTLMRTEDLEQMAVAHDQVVGRAKTMAVVAAYLRGRGTKGEKS